MVELSGFSGEPILLPFSITLFLLPSAGDGDRFRNASADSRTGDESDEEALRDLELLSRFSCIFPTRKLIVDFELPESRTLLLDRENIFRVLRGSSSVQSFLLLALELGQSSVQLFDLLRPEESRVVLAEPGVCGEEERRLAQRGGGISTFSVPRVFST